MLPAYFITAAGRLPIHLRQTRISSASWLFRLGCSLKISGANIIMHYKLDSHRSDTCSQKKDSRHEADEFDARVQLSFAF